MNDKPTLEGLQLREILEGHFGKADKYALDCSEADISQLIADIIGKDFKLVSATINENGRRMTGRDLNEYYRLSNKLLAEQRQRAKEAGVDI